MASSGLSPSALTWRFMYVATRPFCGRRFLAHDVEQRTPSQFSHELLRRSFGPQPDMDIRPHMLGLPAGVALASTLLTGCIVPLALLGSGAIFGFDPVPGIKASSVAASYFISLTCVWAVRWQLMLLDFRRWDSQGCPPEYQARPHANPRDRDFLYAVPLAALLAWVFLSL